MALIDPKTRIGNLAEIKTAAYYAAKGFAVFVPWGGKSNSDLIAESENGSLLRIQVKSTATSVNGSSWVVQLRTVRSNKTKNVVKKFDGASCDVLAVYIEPEDRLEFFNPVEYDGRSNINIRKVGRAD